MKKTEKAALLTGTAYLGAVMPKTGRKSKSLGQIYYAHRGLHDNAGTAPENTLPAFVRAVKAGYGIELDVQLTKDEQVVVTHDFHLRRNCKIDKEVDQMTYREICELPVFGSEEHIPLLTEVLELVDGQVPLLIELKYKHGSTICQKADEILKDYHGDYCIESFHPQVLLWYRKNRPEIARGQLSMNYQRENHWYGPQYYIMRYLLTNFITKPDFIAYDCRAGHSFSLQLCRHLFRCPAYAWTIRSRKELEKAKRLFDGYIFEGFRP